MKKVLNLAMYLLVASFLFVSCSNDGDDDDSTPSVSVDGIYVLNEGYANGSISMIDADGNVTSNYFEAANGISLGQYPQSMTFSGDNAFIVVTTTNSAGYVEVVTASDFKHYATIEGLSYPRDIAIDGDKAYISNGTGADGNYLKENNELKVVDLNTMEITSEIAVGAGPEKIIISGDKLYVANSGGWSNDDNTVSVIDLDTDELIKTVTVLSCPTDMVKDANGDFWVYCGGVPDYTNYPDVSYTNAGISKIDGDTYEVTSFGFSSRSATGIKNIAVSEDAKTVYFISDAVYAMDYKATELPTEKFIDGVFYGLDVNPENGNIWCCDAMTGTVVVYNDEAEEIASHIVGTMPNSTNFKH